MILTSQKARDLYEKIVTICSKNESCKNKLVGKPGLSLIFNDIINTLTMSQTGLKSNKDKINAILTNHDPNPGPDLSHRIEKLGKDFYMYYKEYWAPSESDYKRCVKWLAEFLAFYSETQIPDTVKTFYDNETKAKGKGNMNLQIDDLIDNPTPRVPVVLCLDTSGSMNGEKINELNAGVKLFFQSVLEDKIAKFAVELCIVTFNTQVKKLLDFSYIEKQVDAFSQIHLVASGNTAMGTAVNMSLDLLEKRKQEYQDKGVDYWQPWLVLMTDGQPTESISEAAARTRQLIENKKLTIFPIGIGAGASMRHLEEFSPNRKPLRLKGLMMSEFFNWLSMSVKTTSQSTPGSVVKLPPIGWAEV